jgi:hypothetical protein
MDKRLFRPLRRSQEDDRRSVTLGRHRHVRRQ